MMLQKFCNEKLFCRLINEYYFIHKKCQSVDYPATALINILKSL